MLLLLVRLYESAHMAEIKASKAQAQPQNAAIFAALRIKAAVTTFSQNFIDICCVQMLDFGVG